MANNYVDNVEFYELMCERHNIVEEALRAGKPKPRINDKIGKIILDISTNLAYKMNFINYTFREEMVSDAIENCILYLDNFNPEKSKNPFAYFTQICYYAFIRRISKESKQTEIKKKIIERMGTDLEMFDVQDHDMDEHFRNTMIEFSQDNL